MKTPDTFSPELRVAMSAVREAAKAIADIKIFGTEEEKDSGINDFITIWDRTVQRIISEKISQAFPQDLILSEESETFVSAPQKEQRLWVVDPIDGTSNARIGRR